MSQYRADHAEAFLRLLTGDSNSVNTYQLFYDPKDGSKRPDLAETFTAKLKQVVNKIESAEKNLQGVYVCINETDRRGRENHNITKIRALFADFDGRTEPDWPISPHFITRRDETHGHAYWLVDDVEVDEFMYLQKRISLVCNTDSSVTDPCRVVRLPGTLHLKDPDSLKMYWVDKVYDIPRYNKQQVINGFQLCESTMPVYEKWVASREAKLTRSGFNDNEGYKNKFIKFLTENAEPAVEGSGSNTLIRVVSFAFDHGLQLDTAKELAWQHYNPRCVPPWGENERQQFEGYVEHAYKYAKNEPGCRTASAAFSDAEPLPSIPVKKNIEMVQDGDRMACDIAEANLPMQTAKSPHYDLARVFDGIMYNGVGLLRSKKIFYRYNGKSWDVVDDDVIKSNIQKFYAKFKPADALVQGILKSLCDLVNVEKVVNGVWMHNSESADNVICFNNSLVDLSDDKAVVIDHTPSFFCFNKLNYDYEPASLCPRWNQYLTDIFEHDQLLITQLQEFFGYCMTTDIFMQVFALFIGKSRGGKGVITRILRTLIGEENAVAPTLSKLTNDSTLASMSIARLALIPDAHSIHHAKRDDVLSIIKAVTGGDPIDYHVMYKGTQNSIFRTKFIMSTNNMPEFIDASGALANRMLVFPFEKSFAGKEDITLEGKLHDEITGIAQWAIEGLRRLRRSGKFTIAPSGLAEKENIKEDMNPLQQFIDDLVVVKTDGFASNDHLYRAYMLWCRQHYVASPLSPNKLKSLLKASDLPIKQDRGYTDEGQRLRGFKGINVVNFPAIEGAN